MALRIRAVRDTWTCAKCGRVNKASLYNVRATKRGLNDGAIMGDGWFFCARHVKCDGKPTEADDRRMTVSTQRQIADQIHEQGYDLFAYGYGRMAQAIYAHEWMR